MAKPRVFVSSTYYDLKHLRSSLENFIDNLGYEPVLSEKDNIAYLPDVPLDESCYREARNADIYVLIIGGRYGSQTSAGKDVESEKKEFYERYESITKQEYDSACDKNIPVYVLIESSVDSEYQTWLRNKDNNKIEYAHVDSVNIFYFIEMIREKQRNNPIKTFNKYSEIELWLKEQWAGFFRELIHRMGAQYQIEDLDSKINSLSATSETLKHYLEEVVSQVSKEKADATEIIKKENERLKEFKRDAEFLSNPYVRHLHRSHDLQTDHVRRCLLKDTNFETFIGNLFRDKPSLPVCTLSRRAFDELNDARDELGKKSFPNSQHEAFVENNEDSIRSKKEINSTKTRNKTAGPIKKKVGKKPAVKNKKSL